jgi:hypothetical protein
MERRCFFGKAMMAFFTLTANLFAWGGDAVAHPYIYVYTFNNNPNIEIVDCESFVPDATIKKLGYVPGIHSMWCREKDTKHYWTKFETKTILKYSLHFEKKGEAMYIDFSYMSKWFSSQRFNTQCIIHFTYWPRDGIDRDVDRDVANLINWFETHWIGELQWEKTMKNRSSFYE